MALTLLPIVDKALLARLTERTIEKEGRHMLLPEFALEGWSTSLPKSLMPAEIIDLRADHGTHEQCHSEFKTYMDLTRLPSGKFDTSHLVCTLAVVAMNMVSLMGQHTMHEPQ